MKNNFFSFFLLAFLLLGCKKKESENAPSYYRGSIDLYTDDSFKSVAKALADAYMISYPEAKINVVTKKEDFSLLDLLNNKAHLIIMSRELSPEEKKVYKDRTELELQPTNFAADAVVFVVPKDSPITALNYDEIKAELNSEEKKFVFDGTNSSNLNFVAQKLNQKPSELKFSIISGNENLIAQLKEYPNKIGVVGLNAISRPYGNDAERLRNEIKILPVTYKGKTYEPIPENFIELKYPFTRVLYFLTNDGSFNLANGFIRFSCTQLGQLVVEKEGLQPYNLFKREVQMMDK